MLMVVMGARGIFWLLEGALHGTLGQLRPTRSVFFFCYKEEQN